MRLKAVYTNPAFPDTLFDIEHLLILATSCIESGIDCTGAKYYGNGIWSLPAFSISQLEAMAPDAIVVCHPNKDCEVFLEDARQWLERMEELEA